MQAGVAGALPWVDVAASAELAEGALLEPGPWVTDVPLVVARVEGAVRAVSGVCPHKFGRMAEGRLAGRHLTCPVHTATFDLATGEPGDGQQWAGRLAVYEARERDGRVEVLVP